MGKPILSVEHIGKSFGRKKIINDVTFSLSPGEVFGFLGPNGAGKTTLIRIILGLVRSNQGIVSINGFDTRKSFKQAISQTGAVVEIPRFYLYLSGYQNLNLVRNLHPGTPKKKIEEVLEIVGLGERGFDKVGTYSLGMKQRLGLARAIINDPKIVFLDEPMNGLDPQGMYDIRVLIKRLQRESGITFFITSHLLHEVEQVCDTIAVLKEGEILTQGNIHELLASESETVVIHTPEPEPAAAALTGIPYVRSFDILPGKLLVHIDRNTSAELTRLLVSRKLEIQYIIPQKHSLEEFFFKMAHGGEDS